MEQEARPPFQAKDNCFTNKDDAFRCSDYDLETVDFPLVTHRRGRYEGLLRKRVELILINGGSYRAQEALGGFPI